MAYPNRTQKFLKVIRDNPGCTNAFAVTESGVGNKNTASEFVAAGYIEMIAKVETVDCPGAACAPKRRWVNTYRITEAGRQNILKGLAPVRKKKPVEGKPQAPVRMRRGTAAPVVKVDQVVVYPENYKHTACPTGLCQSIYNPATPMNRTGLAMWS